MWLDALADLLSRPRCAACADLITARDHVLCASCAASVERCPVSDSSWLSFAYYGGAIAQAVHHFKYGGQSHLARPLGHLLRGLCHDAQIRADLVIPVPLHPTRLVARGYNQAALLGRQVAAQLGLPLCTGALLRTVPTRTQAELDRAARLSNVAGAFAVYAPARVRHCRVLLVDDVVTTGATLAACSDALLKAEVGSITCMVLARTLSEPAPQRAVGHPRSFPDADPQRVI